VESCPARVGQESESLHPPFPATVARSIRVSEPATTKNRVPISSYTVTGGRRPRRRRATASRPRRGRSSVGRPRARFRAGTGTTPVPAGVARADSSSLSVTPTVPAGSVSGGTPAGLVVPLAGVCVRLTALSRSLRGRVRGRRLRRQSAVCDDRVVAGVLDGRVIVDVEAELIVDPAEVRRRRDWVGAGGIPGSPEVLTSSIRGTVELVRTVAGVGPEVDRVGPARL